jgi:cell fate (sporulation/competence/biofilm development) regulator YlbF (YheA/YmcA/DUF963 family)
VQGGEKVSVLTKAVELGVALSQSEELQNVREAEQKMFADEEARGLLEEFQQCRQELEFLRLRGMEPSPEQQEAFGSVRARMQQNPLISGFLQAQENFDQVLRQINQILNQAISGSGGCSPDKCSGCGSGCEE